MELNNIDKFNVAYCAELGRYAIASKDHKSGDSISGELPFAYGPKSAVAVICLGCYKPLKNVPKENSRCSKCKWPLCFQCNSKICPDHAEECEIFATGKVKFFENNLDCECIQLDCITPLRVLLKKESDSDSWNREVKPMEYHDIARRENQETWNADLINVARYLRGPCKLTRFSEDLIMQVIGILQVNAFEAKTPQGYPIRCLFPITGILAHNCVPNTIRSIYPSEGYRIRLRALVDIEKDSQLFVSYTFTLDGTEERQAHLKSGKYFTCRCNRCSDPTELGTHFSSIRCTECDSGYVSVIDPFDNESAWKCTKCEKKFSSGHVKEILNPILSEVGRVEAMQYSEARLEYTEQLNRKFDAMLPDLHFVQTNLRQSLVQMYGRVSGYELSNLPDFMLEYKVELCNLVLKVLNVFEPGLSRSRACLLYELHAPLVIIARRLHAGGAIDKQEYKEKLEEIVSILEESVRILENEDAGSSEGLLAAIGRKGLLQLTESIAKLNNKADK